jgi:hypothetical protein
MSWLWFYQKGVCVMPELKDFLNPASMLTPGIAGGLTVSISMPIVMAFELKYKWVALLISFLFGLLISSSFKRVPKFANTIYCILNTLVIFSLSVGAAINLDPPPRAPNPPLEIVETPRLPLLGFLLTGLGISTAYADEQQNNQYLLTSPDGYSATASDDADPNVLRSNSSDDALHRYQEEQQQYQKEREQYEERWSW